MKVKGVDTISVDWNAENKSIVLIDQKLLPFEYQTVEISHPREAAEAIRDMTVRGAPAIGIMAAYGTVLSLIKSDGKGERFANFCTELLLTRPTAVNLSKGVQHVLEAIDKISSFEEACVMAEKAANEFAANEINACKRIGEYGQNIIEDIFRKSGKTVQILTHCNAGWLACGDWGTATAPIYMAHRRNIPVHVWVDETRPRNQGSRLTAWELHNEKVPFTIIPDNSGGHLMQNKMVDLVITGADRIALNGDAANKIGTYLKALAARENKVPFYIAAPISTFDPKTESGVSEIPVEMRSGEELRLADGLNNKNIVETVSLFPEEFPVANHAFDVTPASFISGFITDKGIIPAQKNEIKKLL